MAAGVSKWTKFGTNTDAVDVASNPQLANPSVDMLDRRVRHECHMWLDDTDDIETKNFNWPIDGDFTIVFNATKVNLAGTIGTCTVNVVGSTDDVTYVPLTDSELGTGTFDGKVIHYIYDYDANGRLPFMRLRVTTNNGDDRSDTPIKIVVIPHGS